MGYLLRPFLSGALLAAALCMSSAPVLAQASIASEIQRTETLIAQGDYVEALASIRAAAAKAPSDYRVRYYTGMVLLGLQRFEDARTEVELALSLAPAEDKPTVERLLATIDKRGATLTAEADAEAALASGLNGRAARLFAQAFEADRANSQAGLRAAKIYAELLNQPREAVKVLRQIEASATDPAARITAREEFRKLSPAAFEHVADLFSKAMTSFSSSNFDEAKAYMDEAKFILPKVTSLLIADVSLAALTEDEERLKVALSSLAANGIDLHHGFYAVKPKSVWIQRPWFFELLSSYKDQAYVDSYVAASNAKVLQDFRDCADVCPLMTIIPSDYFVGEMDAEGVATVTTVKPVAIGKFEITFDEFDACTREGACQRAQDLTLGRGQRPVIMVSWSDAAQYVDWLSKKTGKKYRLLTEWEWRHAAGLKQPGEYWTGSSINALMANYALARKRPIDVGSYSPNAFGLFDMAGNVIEWLADCHYEQGGGRSGTPEKWEDFQREPCTRRKARGGGWATPQNDMTRKAFWHFEKNHRNNDIGFRVAREL